MSKGTRNPVRQWSVTFPQSGEVTKDQFIDSMPPWDECFCCMEEHEDGGNHLHMGIKLTKGLSKVKFLSYLQGKYPNDYKRIQIEATRSLEKWKAYCKKEDPKVVDKVKTSDKTKSMMADVNKWVEEAGPPPSIMTWCPFCMRDKKIIDMWIIKGTRRCCIDCYSSEKNLKKI